MFLTLVSWSLSINWGLELLIYKIKLRLDLREVLRQLVSSDFLKDSGLYLFKFQTLLEALIF